MTLIKVLLPYTLAVYLAFLVIYGAEVFDTDFTDFGAGGFFDFLGDLTSLIGDFAQFFTLGGFSGLLPAVVQISLLLTFGLGWLLVGLGLGRGTMVG